MAGRLFDIYGIIGLLLSISGVLISIYVSPTKIPLQYVFIVIIAIGILIITMILINKFSSIDNKIKRIKEIDNSIKDLNKRFKTLEDLTNIRLDIKELQTKVFKK